MNSNQFKFRDYKKLKSYNSTTGHCKRKIFNKIKKKSLLLSKPTMEKSNVVKYYQWDI